MIGKQRNFNASKLELNPWKTGVPIAIKALEAAPDTQNICLVWELSKHDEDRQQEQQHLLATNELVASLLEFIGDNMLDLESLSITFDYDDDYSTDATTAMITPPVSVE